METASAKALGHSKLGLFGALEGDLVGGNLEQEKENGKWGRRGRQVLGYVGSCKALVRSLDFILCVVKSR